MRRTHHTRARTAFAWTALAFVGTQFALAAAVEHCRPEANDLEFGERLALLQRRQAEAPERPLFLVVGSSRLVTGFRPEVLSPLPRVAGQEPLPFNFAHNGGGPLLNLIEFQRLQRHGVRPSWLVLEINPPFLTCEGRGFATNVMSRGDLTLLARHVGASRVYSRYLWSQLLACCKYRNELCELVAPSLASTDNVPPFHLQPLGGLRDERLDGEPSPRLREVLTEASRRQYTGPLAAFRIMPEADRALRETIERAQQQGTQVALLVTPESTMFRGWYAPAANDSLCAFHHSLAECYRVPVIDARSWIADEEFMDGHHVFGPAAERFTQRLAAEVFAPLIKGRLKAGVLTPAPQSAQLAQP
jgi:hypothetical protein